MNHTLFFRFICFTLMVFVAGCLPAFRDSPFSSNLRRDERNLNSQNMQKIIAQSGSNQEMRIGVMADSHQNYRDLDGLIKDFNHGFDIDFVVVLGDFTNMGYNFEYDQFIRQIVALHKPFIVVIGNHDAIGSGIELFQTAFGPLNFSFETTYFKFIFFNGNNWETGKHFNISWLENEVAATAKKVYIFTHVPLTDGERFSNAELARFQALTSDPKVNIVLNGHNHVFGFAPSAGSAAAVQVPRVEGSQGVYLRVHDVGNPQMTLKMGKRLREYLF